MSILTVLLDNILEYSKLGFILYDYGGGRDVKEQGRRAVESRDKCEIDHPINGEYSKTLISPQEEGGVCYWCVMYREGCE